MSSQKYYFLPHIGITQSPNPPYTWTDNQQQRCDEIDDKCMGYNSDGQAFDVTAFNNLGARLKHYPENTRGSYFKNKSLFDLACKQVKGKSNGDVCQISSEDAKNSIKLLQSTGKIKEGFASPNHKHFLKRVIIVLLITYTIKSLSDLLHLF